MGQKVNPHGLRVGVIKDWDSKWYAEADFADFLVEDYNIRTYLKKKLYAAGVSKIEIERASDRVKVIIYTAKPGVVIGKGGAEIEKIKGEVQKFTDKKLVVDIKEVKRPDRDAQLVAENIALQLENRVSFRRAMKSCMGRTMKTGAKGKCPELTGEQVPDMLILPENQFAVLINENTFADFAEKLAEHPEIQTVFMATDYEVNYQSMVKNLNVENAYQLYRDYLDHFRVNRGRN